MGTLALESLGSDLFGGVAASRHRFPALMSRILTTPVLGFPSIQPLFGAVFVPGNPPGQLIKATDWNSFSAQIDAAAASGLRLAAMAVIQNQNALWLYASLEAGSGNYQLLRTTDAAQFQKAFSDNAKLSYRLVDFSVSLQHGQLVYAGYWLQSQTAPNQQLLWGLDFNTLTSNWNDLSANRGLRMTRIQAFPQNDASRFTALFEPGTGGYVLYSDRLKNFSSDAVTRFGGNTLTGLSYDLVGGNMVGCWRDPIPGARFVWNQTWDSLTAAAGALAPQGLGLRAMAAYPNAPAFDDYFAANLAPYVEGYAYAVAKDGQMMTGGGGYARSALELVNPKRPFTADVRINLASVSKAVTGVALELLCARYSLSLDAPFLPFLSHRITNAHPTVAAVTLRQLATMTSALQPLPNEGPLDGDLWPYLNSYLSQPLSGTPGVDYNYNNNNFTILQGVIQEVSAIAYTDFVFQNLLPLAGMDPLIFNAAPDQTDLAALSYSGPNDPAAGQYWKPFRFVAAGGWVASASEVLKLPIALRGSSLLPQTTVSQMLNDGIGWYSASGSFGRYFHHNGGLGNGRSPSQQLNTCIVRLGEGYDIALVTNSQPPADVVSLAIGAFESRSLPAADAPPALTAVVHGASFLPTGAPGAYMSIVGSGLIDQDPIDWGGAIPDGVTLPKQLGGVRVRVGSQDAYVQYINPAQVNFLVPLSTPSGPAAVQVITPTGVMSGAVQINSAAPGLFGYRLNGKFYPVAIFGTASGTVYVAATGVLSGLASRPAAPGDVIELYATGLGATNPPAPDGVVLKQAYPLADLSSVAVTIGGRNATVLYAGMTYSGLFQVNIQVPQTGSGDQLVVLSASGAPSQPNAFLTIA